jgi:hypothetical protein
MGNEVLRANLSLKELKIKVMVLPNTLLLCQKEHCFLESSYASPVCLSNKSSIW